MVKRFYYVDEKRGASEPDAGPYRCIGAWKCSLLKQNILP
jgi:hypothetical protein